MNLGISSENNNGLDQLKFEFKEKGRYLNINDYDTQIVFEGLFSNNAKCSADAFKKKCQEYNGRELTQLKEIYVDILGSMEKMIDKDITKFVNKIEAKFTSNSYPSGHPTLTKKVFGGGGEIIL